MGLSTLVRWSPHSGVEQLVARLAHNQEVAGSSPAPGTTSTVMLCAIYVNGDGAAESRVHCTNWGFLQNYPPMAEFQGDAGFLELVKRLEGEGGIQVVVVHRFSEVPDMVWLLKVLADHNVYLVSVGDEIDTRPFDIPGAGQERFLKAMAGWAAAMDKRYQEEEGEAEEAAKVLLDIQKATGSDQPLRAMNTKEIKGIKAKRTELGVVYSADDADDTAGAELEGWVMSEYGVSQVQASKWLAEFA